jgi:hypothetical protein
MSRLRHRVPHAATLLRRLDAPSEGVPHRRWSERLTRTRRSAQIAAKPPMDTPADAGGFIVDREIRVSVPVLSVPPVMVSSYVAIRPLARGSDGGRAHLPASCQPVSQLYFCSSPLFARCLLGWFNSSPERAKGSGGSDWTCQ